MNVCFLLAIFVGVVFCDEHAPNALSYDTETFSTELSKRKHFVMFYAPWCGHCKRLAPVWDELAQYFNKELDMSKLIVATVDCTLETALCAEQEVSGYPTLKYYGQGTSKAILFRGNRDLKTFQDFLEEQDMLEERREETHDVPETKPLGPLVELTDETFEETIATGKTFVKFYAPWCGHCKKLAPTWEALAKEFEDEPSVTIAKVDCTLYKSTCGRHSIRGYPSLIFFQDGEKDSDFQNRDLQSLTDFVNKKITQKKKSVDTTEGMVPDDIPKEEEDKAEPSVMPLDQDTFPEVVAKGVKFVMFYAPWCGHCKRLAPVWEELSTKFDDSSVVGVGKVDCTTEQLLCKLHKVRGYPTLLLFRDGEMVEEYSGARSIGSLETFIRRHVKVHEEL